MPIKNIFIYIHNINIIKFDQYKGIQEKRLGITMTNYGHHVRVALKKNQTSLRLEKAIFK